MILFLSQSHQHLRFTQCCRKRFNINDYGASKNNILPSNMALSGHTLRVALETWQPYIHFPEEAEQDYSLISGVAFDSFNIIAQKLNVS